jgi:hypothetical protein
VIKFFRQFLFVLRDDDAPYFAKVFRGRHLMVVPRLSETRSARHYNNRFSHFQSRDDRAHPGMSYNQLGSLN